MIQTAATSIPIVADQNIPPQIPIANALRERDGDGNGFPCRRNADIASNSEKVWIVYSDLCHKSYHRACTHTRLQQQRQYQGHHPFNDAFALIMLRRDSNCSQRHRQHGGFTLVWRCVEETVQSTPSLDLAIESTISTEGHRRSYERCSHATLRSITIGIRSQT